MLTTLRHTLMLALALALIAWGASGALNWQAREWAERDLAMRARLVLAGARASLLLAPSERSREILQALVRDERLMGAELCHRDGSLEVASQDFPADFGCQHLAPAVLAVGAEGWDSSSGGPPPVHVSVLPLDEHGMRLMVLVHDMSFVQRRATATRNFTLAAFALVGFVGALAAPGLARLSWLRWTRQVRRLLTAPFRAAGAVVTPPHFQPLLADVRDLVSSLAVEEARAAAAWTPARLKHVLRRQLGGEGIIVVANREPYIHELDREGKLKVIHPASGLVTALEPVMRACSGTWIAHGSGSGDRATVDVRDRVKVPPDQPSYTLRRLWLTSQEERGYYYGLANEGLWPLCHLAHVRPEFRGADWEQYRAVNRRFADAVADEADGPDPIVLVQDYHFALLPRFIRERLPRATILTFWHIPWPNAERFGICPWEREVLEGLLGSSIVGFHTQAHCNNFIDSVDRYIESRIDRERQSVNLAGRETLVRPYPISIEWPSRWAEATPPADQCRREVRAKLGLPADAHLGIGVDRLDYTKGIEERLRAVERMLERFPSYRGRFWFAQVAAPSRTAIEAYHALGARVEALAANINQRLGTERWRPIVLLREHHEAPAVFRMYRAADLCFVSSVHDGMNLVAKEFVAARDDLRGVLVLSRFTGAASELTEAVVVNPYDLESTAAALASSLVMLPEEQADRMRAMRAILADLNVYRWAGKMLLDATRTRRRDRLSARLAGAKGSAA